MKNFFGVKSSVPFPKCTLAFPKRWRKVAHRSPWQTQKVLNGLKTKPGDFRKELKQDSEQKNN